MTHPHLEPLKRKLLKAAMDLMTHAGVEEFNSFDLVADGQRLVIEIAMLPPVTRACEGARRAEPQAAAKRPAFLSSRQASLAERA